VAFRNLVEKGLRMVIERQQKPIRRFRLRDCSFDPSAPDRRIPWAEMPSAIYEGRGE